MSKKESEMKIALSFIILWMVLLKEYNSCGGMVLATTAALAAVAAIWLT